MLSHQFLGQLEPPVLRSLGANTSIKMVARLEGADRAALARDMNCTPDFIRDQPVGSFATYLRGVTPNAIAMKFPLSALSQFERMTAVERQQVQDRNRQLYANPVAATHARHKTSDRSQAEEQPKPSSGRRDPDADKP